MAKLHYGIKSWKAFIPKVNLVTCLKLHNKPVISIKFFKYLIRGIYLPQKIFLCTVGDSFSSISIAGIFIDFKLYLYILFHSRGLFIIDGNGILRQITMNDLPVSNSCTQLLIINYNQAIIRKMYVYILSAALN